MNLIAQAIEYIYKYGNFTLQHYLNAYEKYLFLVNDNKNIDLFLIHGNKEEKVELEFSDLIYHLTCIVGYSVANKLFPNYYDACITVDTEHIVLEENRLESVNNLYNIFSFILFIDVEKIKFFVSNHGDIEPFLGEANNLRSQSHIHSDFDYSFIIKSLEYKFNQVIVICELCKENNEKDKMITTNSLASNIQQNLENISSELLSQNLNVYCDVLTNEDSSVFPAFGRDMEIRLCAYNLLTLTKSVLLVSNPGIGKTAIVEGLAYLIKTKQVPDNLKNIKIIKINVSSLVSGCGFVGDFEEKMERVMEYFSEQENFVLFLDEIHTAIGAGRGTSGGADLANILKPYLDRGKVKIIGATTLEEYEQYLKDDEAFVRRFGVVSLKEPDDKTLFKIIKGYIKKLEEKHSISWNFEDSISKNIINHVIKSTEKAKRSFDYKRYNPEISVTIIEYSFAIAMYNNLKSVTLENVAEAIRISESLHIDARNRDANSLLKLSVKEESPLSKVKKKGTIVPFGKKNEQI